MLYLRLFHGRFSQSVCLSLFVCLSLASDRVGLIISRLISVRFWRSDPKPGIPVDVAVQWFLQYSGRPVAAHTIRHGRQRSDAQTVVDDYAKHCQACNLLDVIIVLHWRMAIRPAWARLLRFVCLFVLPAYLFFVGIFDISCYLWRHPVPPSPWPWLVGCSSFVYRWRVWRCGRVF